MRNFSENRSTIFMNATLVATISKNKREEIRVSVLRNNKVDVRTYFYFPDAPDAKPTKKGIWLSFKHIPAIIAAFTRYAANPAVPFMLEFDVPDRPREKTRVYVNEYLGSQVIHIRTFFLKQNELTPGRGISFAAPLLPKMIEALTMSQKYREK
jgi:hypothetical protein